MQSTAALLDLLIDRAPLLRTAGVRSLTIDAAGTLTCSLAPLELAPADTADDAEPTPLDPMQDPTSYGLPPGAKVPGFTRDPPRREDADP